MISNQENASIKLKRLQVHPLEKMIGSMVVIAVKVHSSQLS